MGGVGFNYARVRRDRGTNFIRMPFGGKTVPNGNRKKKQNKMEKKYKKGEKNRHAPLVGTTCTSIYKPVPDDQPLLTINDSDRRIPVNRVPKYRNLHINRVENIILLRCRQMFSFSSSAIFNKPRIVKLSSLFMLTSFIRTGQIKKKENARKP